MLSPPETAANEDKPPPENKAVTQETDMKEISEVPPITQSSNVDNKKKRHSSLILPSAKRRGVYECDYCHSDISQAPRIRCDQCPDFDLCLDCFATVDHAQAVARIQAAVHVQSELQKDDVAVSTTTNIAALNHNESHGYRVCDSLRYPLFPVEWPDQGDLDDGADDASSQQPTADTTQDLKRIWTVEEDLRLLEAIRHCGLGNWGAIHEYLDGSGSVGKSPRKCMERYFDHFLGRYGQILPPYVYLIEPRTESAAAELTTLDEAVGRASLVAPSAAANNKRFVAVATACLPEGQSVWTKVYLPNDKVVVGQEVRRPEAVKAELTYVKTIAGLTKQEDIDKVTKEWRETKLNQPGGPTVLPPRPDDVAKLPGADLHGFMPRRGEFDIEWDNDAEQAMADMEFLPGDTPEERDLKLKVLAIYNSKLDERDKRKQFIFSRQLFDYRKYQAQEQSLPRDERDLVHRMRLFERFHTPEEHQRFLGDILKAKRLRKEIAKLQMYRRMGIRTMVEAEQFELDKGRRQFHKEASQKNLEKQPRGSPAQGSSMIIEEGEYWRKQYRTSNRKVRRSLSRGRSLDEDSMAVSSTASFPVAMSRTSSLVVDDPTPNVSAGVASIEGPPAETSDLQEMAGKEANNAEQQTLPPEVPTQFLPGEELLSIREKDLCTKLDLKPLQYIEIKKALIAESMKKGLLESGSSRPSLAKIDVERQGKVVNFLVQAGWISS